MVRVKTIRVSDGDVDITVTARVESSGLAFFEADKLIHALASSVMAGLPKLPYVGAHLSQIKVS